MTRDSILADVLDISATSILLEMGTGTGKTKLALEKTKQWVTEDSKVLVVVPKTTVITSWQEEIVKWEATDLKITIICYDSLEKYVSDSWDVVVFDECHHLTENALTTTSAMQVKHFIFLSASITHFHKRNIAYYLGAFVTYNVDLRTTIEEKLLPDPRVILIRLHLDYKDKTACQFVINPTATKVDPVIHPLTKKEYWAIKTADKKVKKADKQRHILQGSQWEYHVLQDSRINLYKKRASLREQMLRLSGDRLKWLARLKNDIVKALLRKLAYKRVLTFCCDIEQTEVFGPNAINSKNKESLATLARFNEGKIKHIQACSMLDEGVNLKDCQIGLFANLNSSDRIIIQRTGRILRHKDPIIIVPYYVGTREEEIVEEMKKSYNEELITVINDISDFKL